MGARLTRAALLCGAFLLPPHAGDAVLDVLRRRRGEEPRAAPELVRGLAELGEEELPRLCALALGRGVDDLVGDGWSAATWSCAPDEVRALSAAALERIATRDLARQLDRVLDEGATSGERIVMLGLLGAHGSADGLAPCLRIAADLEPFELRSPRAREALRAALTPILMRDGNAWPLLVAGLDGLGPLTAEVVADAVGDSGRARGAALLERMLDLDDVSRAHVASALARLERARPWDVGGTTMRRCGALLRSASVEEQALGARLAAVVHALDAIPELIEMTQRGEPRVRLQAREALDTLAGVPLAADAESLESWHRSERAWRESRWTALGEALVGSDAGAANAALGELALHPLYRHEAARDVAASLLRQPRAVAIAACAELEALRSLWAVPGLVATLEHAPPPLRAAAWRALRGLTGAEQALSAVYWRMLLES